MSSGLSIKSFVTQDEIDEKKKKRQEEWEKVRKPNDPLECPEEPEDNRCLYDKLEEQRLKKQEAYEEQFALKNQVKGIDEDEAKFLDFVADRQQEIAKEKRMEEKEILSEMKDAQVIKITDSKTEEKKSKPVQSQSNKKSQMTLLAGAVKRKSMDENSLPDKKTKVQDQGSMSSQDSSATSSEKSNQVAKVIGILPSVLPGLCEYGPSSDSESSSDSDEDIASEFTLAGTNTMSIKMSQIKQITYH